MRRLVATWLLALAPASALATTFTEGGIPGGFGDTFAARALLPDGTDVVFGSVTLNPGFPPSIPPIFDGVDYFAFTDLEPGAAFSVAIEKFISDPLAFTIYDDLENVLVASFSIDAEQAPWNPPTVRNGIVPLSGEVVLRASGGGDSGVGYVVTLDAPRVVVPEPGSGLLVGLGLIALARRHAVCVRG